VLFPTDGRGAILIWRLDDRLLESLQRIRVEYDEMPGLHLTRRQITRLWNLDDESCQVVLDVLEATRFLKRTLADVYVRADIVES
jgi:hypothetical protein